MYANPRDARILDNQRRHRLKKHYGVTPERYDEMLSAQDGVCAICSKPCHTGRRLAVDHDHATGVVRGLLCYRCNAMVQCEDAEVLRHGAEYLEGARV